MSRQEREAQCPHGQQDQATLDEQQPHGGARNRPESQPPQTRGWLEAYQTMLHFFEDVMEPEQYAALETQLERELSDGAARLQLSPEEYLAQIGVFPRLLARPRQSKRGLRF